MGKINLKYPTVETSGLLIGDPVTTPGGSNDSLPTLPILNGSPISAGIALLSVNSAYQFPPMSTAERNALNAYNGMIIYNTDTTTFDGYFSGGINAWEPIGGSEVIIDKLELDNGTAGAPSLTFKNDTSTGVWLGGVGILSFSAAGLETVAINDTGIQLLGAGGTPGAAFFYNELNTFYTGLVAQTTVGGLTSNIILTLPAKNPTVNLEPLVGNPGGTLSFSTAGMCFASVAISSAQLKSLYDTPIIIISSPGGSTQIFVHRMACESLTGTAYTLGGNIFLQYGSTPHITSFNATDNVTALFLTAGGITQYMAVVAGKTYSGGLVTSASSGNSLFITNDTQNFATGTFGIIVNVWYSIIPIT